MRSWDGRLTMDSAAASLVTQARAALWPLILEPKLGDLADEYRWADSNFAEEEIIMHGNSEWLPLGIQELGRGAGRGRAQRHGEKQEHPAALPAT